LSIYAYNLYTDDNDTKLTAYDYTHTSEMSFWNP